MTPSSGHPSPRGDGEWGIGRRFPGQIIVEGRAGALQTAKECRRRDTMWTDGSRLDGGGVGACVWQTPAGWTGRRIYLGSNKEVFGAETYAIYPALRALDQR